MKRLILLFALCLPVVGCAYHAAPVTVYGRSGAQFTAPSLCAALTKCLNSTEPECYYDATTLTTSDQQIEVEACKAVKK